MMKIVRITGSSFVKQGSVTQGHPVLSRHWQDVVDEADSELIRAADQETEEAAVEMWLEDPQDFIGGEEGAPQIKTAMVRRADNFNPRKQAASQQRSWDEDFNDAKAHVASLLGRLGNGR